MKVTAVAGFNEQVIEEIKNPPPTPSQSIKLQRHLSANQCTYALSGSNYLALNQYNSQQIDSYELIYWLADKCLCYLFEARWNCEGVDGIPTIPPPLPPSPVQ